MKIVITGSLGNIGRNLAQNLVANNHDVTVVTSDANRQTVIESLGAKAAVGSGLDSVFLTEVLCGNFDFAHIDATRQV
jgi:Trk K+ transport system NAD-binding subunit